MQKIVEKLSQLNYTTIFKIDTNENIIAYYGD